MIGGDADAKETTGEILRELNEHAAELAGPNPTPTERSLAETAALCHLQLRYAEVAAFTAGDGTIMEASYYRRLDFAHRRYLTALRTLATVRRLAVPAVKVVNIARIQEVATVAGKTC
jgi:hypothetical protein